MSVCSEKQRVLNHYHNISRRNSHVIVIKYLRQYTMLAKKAMLIASKRDEKIFSIFETDYHILNTSVNLLG